MEFKISNTKSTILKELDKGNSKVVDIANKAKVHRSLIYAAIKDLISNGMITEELKLTDAGKIMVM